MDAGELAAWRLYFAAEPWGTPAEDERLAILSARVFQSQGVRCTPSAFRIAWGEPTPAKPILDFATGVRVLAAMQG